MTENAMAGWHHRLSKHEFEQTPQDSGGQGSLVCCNPRGHKESDMPWQLNNKEQQQQITIIINPMEGRIT